MDIVVSETNKGKKALLYEGFTYRIDFVLKSEDISWRCTKRGCKAKLRTDKDITMVISGKLDHTHEVDERKLERNQVRLSVKRKANSDVSERPTKIIRSELQRVEENNLTENDLKGLSDIQRWTNLPFWWSNTLNIKTAKEILSLQHPKRISGFGHKNKILRYIMSK